MKCNKAFATHADHLDHLKITSHERTEIRCVGGASLCSRRFTNLAAAVKHIETGKCASGLKATDIGMWIARHDPNNLITEKETSGYLWPLEKNIVSNGGSEDSEDKASIAGTSEPDSTLVGEAFICGICGKTFPLLQSLKSHLNSPIHRREPHIYHCPQPGCPKTFPVLSSLLTHFEYDLCGANNVVWSPMKRAIFRQLAIARVEGVWIDERELYKRAFLDAYPTVIAAVRKGSRYIV